ncbi:hypothetical protein QBC46DRAFT_274770, partial [Diplogelasinospora grovesii]
PFGQRTISFDEVYQNGNAQYKHMIIEHPLRSGDFYILKCDEHSVHFNENPLAGVANHLYSSQHEDMSKKISRLTPQGQQTCLRSFPGSKQTSLIRWSSVAGKRFVLFA